MQEENLEEKVWDKKKIIILLFILIIIGFSAFKFKNLILSENPKGKIEQLFSKSKSQNLEDKEVLGTSSKENLNDNLSIPKATQLQDEASKKIEIIKQEITKLNMVEIASSSPQVQKIINDIKSIEQYPSNQAKDMCQKICSSL